MPDIRIQDFILDEKALPTTQKTTAKKSKNSTAPTLKVEFVSGPDFIITKESGVKKQKESLVVLA